MHSVLKRDCRVTRTGNTHSLINISTSRKRVTNSTAKASCRTAERFYLGWVVVSFVFKLNKPLFCLSVNCNRHFDRAGVDFFAFIKVGNKSFLFERLHTYQSHVHKRYYSLCVFAVNLVTCLIILSKSVFDNLAEC